MKRNPAGAGYPRAPSNALRRVPVSSEGAREHPVQAPRAASRPLNRLLAALAHEDFDRLAPHLRAMPVRRRLILQKTGEPVERVYFPNGGVYSVLSTLSTGETVEAAPVGDEGMLGIEAFFAEDAVSVGDTVLQVPDTDAIILPVQVFRDELARGGSLFTLTSAYLQFFIAQMIHGNMCNAIHKVQQRCARWLLATADRMHQDTFQLSHEFLATMLADQRPTVTEVAGALQQARLIRYRHGHIELLNREGLAAASCECYGIMRAHFDAFQLRLLRGSGR